MNLLPLTLGVRRSSDAEKVSATEKNNRRAQTEKTLRRDDFTCRFCGFRSEQYQRVVPWEGAGDPPFATACHFCEQCVMLERAGLMGAGALVWLPEISQAELNHILRAIYIARSGKTELSPAATRALDALMVRRTDAKKRLGSDDPLLLATVMHESLTDEEYESAAQKLDGVRLLPFDKHLVRTQKGDINQFPQILKYWRSEKGPYAQLPVEQWLEMFKAISAPAEAPPAEPAPAAQA